MKKYLFVFGAVFSLLSCSVSGDGNEVIVKENSIKFQGLNYPLSNAGIIITAQEVSFDFYNYTSEEVDNNITRDNVVYSSLSFYSTNMHTIDSNLQFSDYYIFLDGQMIDGRIVENSHILSESVENLSIVNKLIQLTSVSENHIHIDISLERFDGEIIEIYYKGPANYIEY